MEKKPTDLRNYAAQTKKRLLWAGLGLIGLFGILLIALTYGTPAAGCGLAFFLVALIPVGLIALLLSVLQWVVDRSNRDDR